MGTPYMLHKDAANRKSNQQHLGTIRGSNLCIEIIEYTSPDEAAVCNLASVALPKFVDRATGAFDFDGLRRVARHVIRALDRVIDRNQYPLEEAEASNVRHRPVGLGVQGLADVFAMLRLPLRLEGARELNRETSRPSTGRSRSRSPSPRSWGAPVAPGEPGVEGRAAVRHVGRDADGRWDWAALKAKIAEHGLRNSPLLAPMPTVSTAQILGNNECFEPYTSNLYARRTLAGEFFVLNAHPQRELQNLGLWNRELRDKIISAAAGAGRRRAAGGDARRVRTAWRSSSAR